jgi:hypothetical protein
VLAPESCWPDCGQRFSMERHRPRDDQQGFFTWQHVAPAIATSSRCKVCQYCPLSPVKAAVTLTSSGDMTCTSIAYLSMLMYAQQVIQT